MRRHSVRKSKTLIFGLLPVLTVVLVSTVTFYATTYYPSWDFNWNGIRPEVIDTVNKLDFYGYISSGSEGLSGTTPVHYETRYRLMSMASDQELYKLLDYPQGAIKATAYEALLHRKKYDHYELILKALDDTTFFVDYRSGCVGDMLLLAEYISWNTVYCLTKDCPPYTDEIKEKLPMTEDQLSRLRKLYAERISKKDYYFRTYMDWRQ
ncbi:MAG: hypothetical protein K9J17_13835 [Flavobacteriales bacterium]|nr:hypothetical protein [Flavobacteriales bacterium]